MEKATTRKFRVVQQEGNREIDFYNLDAIIAVGYRVNSHRATQFRIWATAKKLSLTGHVAPSVAFSRNDNTNKTYVAGFQTPSRMVG